MGDARPLALATFVASLLGSCAGEAPCPDAELPRDAELPTDGGAMPGMVVTYESLLEDMKSLETLARPDRPAYRARMASSYDRASVAPDEPGWFGNADAAHFLREETIGDRTEFVMLDASGPGAVTRIWTAKPVGTLRVYLDGDRDPAFERAFADLFEPAPSDSGLSYRVPHGEADNCGHHVPLGAGNHYLPIPFERSVVITTDDPDTYYQVSYREYAEGVALRGWTGSDAARPSCVFEDSEGIGAASSDERVVTIGAGTRTELRVEAAARSGSAVRSVAIDLGHTDAETLRAVWVTLAFDGHELVQGPVAEVFGQGGPGLADSESALFSVRGSRMRTRLVMPFRDEVILTFHSGLDAPIEARVEFQVEPFEFGSEDWFLHGHWTPPFIVDASELSEQRHLAIEGGGRYLGNVLNVRNSSRVWWGEGDEKIWVDHETFPSFFGTGTEDYYGFAWCSAAEFAELFHGQTRVEGPELYGRLSMYRWHVPDSIPFHDALAFDLETRHWRDYARVGYEAMHFWYGPVESLAGEAGPVDFTLPPIPEHDPELAGDGDIPHDWSP